MDLLIVLDYFGSVNVEKAIQNSQLRKTCSHHSFQFLEKSIQYTGKCSHADVLCQGSGALVRQVQVGFKKKKDRAGDWRSVRR